MIRYSLICEKNHDFEIWFKNSANYDQQNKRDFANDKLGTILDLLLMDGKSIKQRVLRIIEPFDDLDELVHRRFFDLVH